MYKTVTSSHGSNITKRSGLAFLQKAWLWDQYQQDNLRIIGPIVQYSRHNLKHKNTIQSRVGLYQSLSIIIVETTQKQNRMNCSFALDYSLMLQKKSRRTERAFDKMSMNFFFKCHSIIQFPTCLPKGSLEQER